MIVRVVNSDSLVAALNSAVAGDIIQLATGIYTSFSIKGRQFSGEVTITSENPDAPAILTGFKLWSSASITFSNLELSVDPGGLDNPYLIYDSAHIRLEDLDVHGSLNGDPKDDQAAMLIRSSADVTVTNSEFHELEHGVAHLNSDGLVFSDNKFSEIRSDGIRGGGSSNVLITRNQFSDFRPLNGDHPDGIQFWTGNTTKSAENIEISENVIMRGAGEAIQGIFIRDEAGNPYKNVVITGNLVVGGMPNGISVAGATDVRIEGNTVSSLPDSKSWIRVEDVTNGVLSNNAATSYILADNSGLIDKANREIAAAADGGLDLLEMWIGGAPSRLVAGSFSNDPALNALTQMEAIRLQTLSINGTSGNDRLFAEPARNSIIDAGAGADMIYGGGIGRHTLIGGEGDDTYYVRSGHDAVVEARSEGVDTVIASVDYSLPDNVETLRLAAGASFGEGNSLDNRIVGTDADDQLFGLAGADAIQSLGGNDTISGGVGADTVMAGLGDDSVSGDAGADKLEGQQGNDSIDGGAGDDLIDGGVGADWLLGGSGADRFTFREISMTSETIVDFTPAEGDKVSLSLIDANVLTPGDGKFAFIATEAFHRKAGELRYEIGNEGVTLLGDIDGDGVADLSIFIVGQASLKAADFLL